MKNFLSGQFLKTSHSLTEAVLAFSSLDLEEEASPEKISRDDNDECLIKAKANCFLMTKSY